MKFRLTPLRIIIALCLFFSVCAALSAGETIYKAHADIRYDEKMSDYYTTEEDEDKPLSMDIDFQSLLARNSNTVGWIYLPGTTINYPVVQTKNNTDYLNTRFDGNASDYGTIFADYRSDLKNGNNIILYGHNQGKYNPVKFTQLHDFLNEPDFIQSHPYFEYYDAETGKGTIYDIFAVLRADITTAENINNYYQNCPDEKYDWYLNWLQKQTLVTSEVKVDPSCRSMILSTCTDDADWQRVLVCGLERKGGDQY